MTIYFSLLSSCVSTYMQKARYLMKPRYDFQPLSTTCQNNLHKQFHSKILFTWVRLGLDQTQVRLGLSAFNHFYEVCRFLHLCVESYLRKPRYDFLPLSTICHFPPSKLRSQQLKAAAAAASESSCRLKRTKIGSKWHKILQQLIQHKTFT